MLDAQTLWYVTRATGVVSLLLLTAAVLLGITEAVRWASDRWPRFVTAGLHKNISLIATSFIAVHVVTAVVDGFAPISWLDVVVPFRSPYRPIWLGLGTVAVDLLIALVLTSLLRRRIGPTAWRFVHWSAYACWPVALVHGLGTGTDTKTSWVLGIEAACLSLVVIATWWRIAFGWPSHVRRRVVAASASALAPLLIAAWVLAGPLQSGWARRAGTPASLLSPVTSEPSGDDAAGAPPPASAPFGAAFDSTLSGTLAETQPDRRGSATITIDSQLVGGEEGSATIVLRGSATDDGGITLDSGQVTLTIAGSAEAFAGAVTQLRGDEIDATVSRSDGVSLVLQFELNIDDRAVSGTLHGSPQ